MKFSSPIKLRWHLVLLVLATVLPLLLFTSLLIRQEIKQQQLNADRALRDTVRALSLAVDREIYSAQAVLETLAGSQAIDEGNLQRFYRLAEAAVAKRQNAWVVLLDLTGHQLINTDRPFGATLPNTFREGQPQGKHSVYPDLPLSGAAQLKRVVATGQPAVSDVFISLIRRKPAVLVAIPVLRSGDVHYVLDLVFELEPFTRLLLEQRMPAGSVGMIMDSKGIIIGRTIDPERFIGRRASAGLIERAARSDEGAGVGKTLDGLSLYSAYVRSKTTNWTTVVGVPQAAANAALDRTFYILFGGGALLLFSSLIAALLVGRRITEPISALAERAGLIQRGGHIQLKPSDVAEVKQLQDALVAAGTAAQAAHAERERRLTAEVKQAAAEAAQAEILEREAKLQESEERLRAFLENSATVAWMSDEDGRYVYLSRNYLKRFNLDQQAWQGKTAFELWPAATAEKFRQRDLAVLGHGGLQEVIEEAKNADGSRSWWFNSRFMLSDRSGKRYVGGLGVEITERKRLENELERRIDELKEADRRKDEFLATLSHELRNPLAPISNAVQVLKAIAPGDAKLEWCRNLIDQQVGYMARLMEDLLDVSRITRDKLDLRKQPVALSEIVNNAVETSRPAIDAGGHRLTVDLPKANIVLDGDPARLTQVFANLLNNAAKYMESGGAIRITARLNGVPTLPARESGQGEEITEGEAAGPADGGDSPSKSAEVVVSVADTGIGIAPEMLPHVFDMFFQAEGGRERRYGGLGIGLTLVRSLVELHGGSIEVKSAGVGKGSEFEVRLPVRQAGLAAVQRTPERAAAQAVAATGKRVVIVDDNKMQAQTLAMLIEMMGYRVRTAYDGASALGVIAEFLPQAALIDIGLPGMNGYDLARRLRELPQLNGITLIAQTGWGREEDRQQSNQAGFQHHLTKPLDHQLLEKILREI